MGKESTRRGTRFDADSLQLPETYNNECLVLSELANAPEYIPLVGDIINGDMFSSSQFKRLWYIFLERSERREVIDMSVATSLVDTKTATDLCCPKYGVGLGSMLSITEHCNNLRNAYLKRVVFSRAYDLMKDAGSNAVDAETLIEQSRALMESISSGIERKTTESLADTLNNLADTIQDTIQKKSSGKRTRVPTGFAFLDALTYSGFNAGDLVILSGRPSVGKTAILVQMAETASRAGFPATIFSLETTNEQVAQRLLFSTGMVTPKQLSNGSLVWEDLEMANKQFDNLPLYLNDKARTLEQITSEIMRANQRGECAVAFIDYLGLIAPANPQQSRYQVIAECTARLKQVAKQCRIPIVLLSQLNRNTASENRSPQLYDLRECGSIEQDADVVLMLERESPDLMNRNVNMWVRKNRQGKAGEVCVQLEANETFTRFWERG